MEGDNHLYRECLRNHAASLGNYATDGCGEFTLDDTTPPGVLQCAACGCHRSFHRKVTYSGGSGRLQLEAPEIIDYGSGGRNIQSPESSERMRSKRRFRTKFTPQQKEKMLEFAEKLGWRLQRIKDAGDDEVERFCRGLGISRKVFKVWMHNHKNSSSSSSSPAAASASNGNASFSSLTRHHET